MPAKRRALTTDDLMRMQEDGPARKRPREDITSDQENQDDYTDSDEDFELPRLWNNKYDESEAAPGSGSEGLNSGSDEEEEEEEEESRESPLVIPDEDELSSRVSIVPRTSLSTINRTATTRPVQATTFAEFGVSAALLNSLHKISIRMPTEIQAACIPPLLQGESSSSIYDLMNANLIFCKAETA